MADSSSGHTQALALVGTETQRTAAVPVAVKVDTPAAVDMHTVRIRAAQAAVVAHRLAARESIVAHSTADSYSSYECVHTVRCHMRCSHQQPCFPSAQKKS